MNLTVTGYSTALFATWFFIDELGIVFDAGDGLSAGLLQKGGKVKHVFISHADRDHLTGLLQFNQLNGYKGSPIIYYPKACGSFSAMQAFTAKFDPRESGAEWCPIEFGSEHLVGKDLFVEAIRNSHVSAPDEISKSLSYKIYRTKRKLKAEYAKLSGDEIRDLIVEKGNDFVTKEVRENVLNYSGDTPVADYERWNNSNILIHEATFLGNDDELKHAVTKNKHSNLSEVMEMLANINVNKVILSHFSPRYHKEEIDAEIKRLSAHFNLKMPIYRMIPGQVHKNILSENPINI
ncbi:MAG: RNAse Z [Crocinitomix sp.]|nr:RNAse Z [Crocinitomix sp.]